MYLYDFDNGEIFFLFLTETQEEKIFQFDENYVEYIKEVDVDDIDTTITIDDKDYSSVYDDLNDCYYLIEI